MLRILGAVLCLCLALATGGAALSDETQQPATPKLSIGELSFSAWARPELEAAIECGLLSEAAGLGRDLRLPATREQFIYLMMELIAAEKQLSVNELAEQYGICAPEEEASPSEPQSVKTTFTDTDSLHAALAGAMGIAKGSGGLFRPDDGITRCEAAVLLQRCMAVLGRPEANTAPPSYSDVYEMPRWSVEAIKYCSARTDETGRPVMSGYNGRFSPLDDYTLEQAVATLLRCRSSLAVDTVLPSWREAQDYDTVTLELSFGGDCTFGSGIGFAYKGSFPEMYSLVSPDYFFGGIEEFFTDDLTMVNFEGTLTDSTRHAVKTYCFKGSPEYAKALREGSIDVVTVANNHSMDYLQQGFDDTLANLSPYVTVSGFELLPIVEVKGVKIGFASNLAWDSGKAQTAFVDNAVASLRERGAELIIFNYHWGIERSYKSCAYQRALAHYCIDAGADLVIGHHPHVAQETETYKGKHIAYSLGNLVFGGNHNPKDKGCLIFRQSFTVDLDTREISDAGFSAIPYKVSSVDYRNDYRPTKR